MSTKIIQEVDVALREKYFPGLASLALLRLDLPDPIAGGNKSFKLKYHFEAFRKSGAHTLLSFGGAFSNHIAALAHAGKVNAVSTIGIMRGDELNAESNNVLQFAASCGMELHFVSRNEYSRRYDENYHDELRVKFPGAYIVAEGGSGENGIRGCTEILSEKTESFDEIIVPIGTGATCEGLKQSATSHQRVTGIEIVSKHAPHALGGYAQSNDELDVFIETMKRELSLPLDHVYSGKTLFAIRNMTKAGHFCGKRLLFIHTGGYAFAG